MNVIYEVLRVTSNILSSQVKRKVGKEGTVSNNSFQDIANNIIREMQIGNMGRDDKLYMYEALVYQFQLMKPECIKTKYLNNRLV